ncbi:endo-1,4-beta-xylanase [Chryseolinea sp. H1M3-3]|uniref:endo-1,4-beta-xylanase n=1 Tax=Chryseolinea sp. H1M3-3 TaxID=3034144 RepID=UPI0023EC9F92|nr:endo-1,4-beta-xylanase [Chryseolinea sp. H1M3-3]
MFIKFYSPPIRKIGFCFLLLVPLAAICQPPKAADPDKGLKDYYQSFFPMGVAIRPQSVSGPEAALILKHFSSITAENAMKMGPIHPKENEFFWKDADVIADFAQANKLKLRGHTLCWHNQTPNWLFKDDQGKDVTKEVLLKRLKEHITAVVTRYKGKIYAWDVVNEVIDDDDSKYFRESPWYKIAGEEFVEKAFLYAHEADPNALLFYNDYNTESAGKRDRIYKMLKGLLEKKVPIHGVGLQAHWSIFSPTEDELRQSIEKFSSLGLQLQFTELDISVYQSEHSRRDRRADESDVLTPEMEAKQIEQYKMAFKLFREYKDKITGVTFWNVSDKSTWLDNFPVRGRKNYPLLFDQNYNPKKAYWEVVRF